VRERKAQFRKATLGHAEASDQVQLDVRRAYAQYLHWQEELLPREQSVRVMELELQKLRTGFTRTRERLEAERLILDAQLSYLRAVQGHLCALAELERAVGHPLPSVL
jgi:outer membrane protein TolC